MKKLMIGGFIIIFSFLFSFPSYGIDDSNTPFVHKPFKKLGRGIANTVSSPLELPNQMLLQAKEGETWWEQFGGYCSGIFIGTGWTAWRLCAGAFDIATFPFPNYEYSLIQPEYLITEFQEEFSYYECLE
jgi:putative exosortase-associated protein (TIGR04073 family)